MREFRIKKIIYSLITIIFLLIIIILKSFYKSNINDYTWLNINSIIGWATLLWCIATWKSLRNEVICLYTTYMALLYLFTFGQSLLIIFNLVHKDYDLLYRITSSELIYAQFYTLLSLLSFHLGAIIVCKKQNQYTLNNVFINQEFMDNRNKNMMKAIKNSGIILLIFSLPGFIYKTFNTLLAVYQSGYFALYGYDTGGIPNKGLLIRIFEATESFFVPALICLLIVYRLNIKIRNLLYVILIINVLNGLYIGGRSGSVGIVLIMVLIYHYSIKPLSKSKIIRLGILGYFLISFLSIVANLRDIANKQFTDYLMAFLDAFGKENLFFRTLSEIGWTMFPLAAVMSIVPSSYKYFYGKSYIFALTSIIPNLGFWEVHPAQKYAGGAQWLMEAIDFPFGPGFTLIADAFRNFGWYGFLVLVLLGYILGKIYSSVNLNTINERPEMLCAVLIFFEGTFMSVRGDNINIIRPLFFIVIPIYLLIKIIYGTYCKRKED